MALSRWHVCCSHRLDAVVTELRERTSAARSLAAELEPFVAAGAAKLADQKPPISRL
jgi:hypothetical protein